MLIWQNFFDNFFFVKSQCVTHYVLRFDRKRIWQVAKFQGIKIRENATVYILEILNLADFRHLGLLCTVVVVDEIAFQELN